MLGLESGSYRIRYQAGDGPEHVGLADIGMVDDPVARQIDTTMLGEDMTWTPSSPGRADVGGTTRNLGSNDFASWVLANTAFTSGGTVDQVKTETIESLESHPVFKAFDAAHQSKLITYAPATSRIVSVDAELHELARREFRLQPPQSWNGYERCPVPAGPGPGCAICISNAIVSLIHDAPRGSDLKNELIG